MTDPIFKHPARYPKHEGDKGQVFDGECNRTDCTNDGARLYNRGTRGLYCRPCGRAINEANRDVKGGLCVEVDHQLTEAEMDQHYDEYRRDLPDIA